MNKDDFSNNSDIENKLEILLIEDDSNLNFFLKKFLENKGYNVTQIKDGKEAQVKALKFKFDLYLLDIALPHVNGLNILKTIRDSNNHAPVIIITDNISINNEILSFNTGANIFHKKPLNFDLLIIQIKNLLNNFKLKQVIQIGDLYIDVPRKIVKKDNINIYLTFNEFNLLLMLVKDQSKVLTRDLILDRILNNFKEVDNGAVDTLISRLRKKLGKYKDRSVIETIHKTGFRLNLDYFY